MDNFSKVLNFNQLFPKLDNFTYNEEPALPFIDY